MIVIFGVSVRTTLERDSARWRMNGMHIVSSALP